MAAGGVALERNGPDGGVKAARGALLERKGPDGRVGAAGGVVQERARSHWRCCCRRWCSQRGPRQPLAVLSEPMVLFWSTWDPKAVLKRTSTSVVHERVRAPGGVPIGVAASLFGGPPQLGCIPTVSTNPVMMRTRVTVCIDSSFLG